VDDQAFASGECSDNMTTQTESLTPAQSRVNGEYKNHCTVAARELASLIEVAQQALDSLLRGDEDWHWQAETGLGSGAAERALAKAHALARHVI
jgi:hypothetical protein